MHGENVYSSKLYRAADRLLLAVVTILFVLSLVLAPWHHSWTEALTIGTPAWLACVWLVRSFGGALVTRCAIASALMIFSSLLIHQAHGMIEMHFSIFVLLAFLLFYRDWVPLVVAAGLIAVLHLGMNLLQSAGQPVWVFTSSSGISLVTVHALFVVIETLLLVWMAIQMRREIRLLGGDPTDLSGAAHELAKGNVDVAIDATGAGAASLVCAMEHMRVQIKTALLETRALNAEMKQHQSMLEQAVRETQMVVQAVLDGAGDQRIGIAGKTDHLVALSDTINALIDNVVSSVGQTQQVVAGALDGDLTKRISLDGKTGHFLALATALNALTENIMGMVETVRKASVEVHSGADEISKGNADLSARTEQQASSLEETAASMEEMTSTVKNNADNAAQANTLALAARDQAERGGSVVELAIAAMNEINASSKKISDIIGVIDAIAFQTNLLALNAAVEAARAGDQGRGFAVVASEVRNLASRSAAAAKEIKGLIDESVNKVSDGTKLVGASGEVLQDIVAGIKKVADVVSEIAASSKDQASGIEQVNKAVMSMDEGTQQNAAMVEEASAASQALSEQAAGLAQLMARYQVAQTLVPRMDRPPARRKAVA